MAVYIRRQTKDKETQFLKDCVIVLQLVSLLLSSRNIVEPVFPIVTSPKLTLGLHERHFMVVRPGAYF